MKTTLTIFALLALPFLTVAQNKADLAQCIQATLEYREVSDILTAGWANQEKVYLRHGAMTMANPPHFTRLFKALTDVDLQGTKFDVQIILPGEEGFLPSEARDRGIVDVSGAFRGDRMSITLFAWLPEDPRQQLSEAYVLERYEDGWRVVE
ncbi:MAG: hypothetical protein KI786_12600 [Mameliella sp.]|nr:hypothetical protein [Phaeodactylibacter sp.]NRA52085.1 hypothetical protein [Phaeodactylibacter sp.]